VFAIAVTRCRERGRRMRVVHLVIDPTTLSASSTMPELHYAATPSASGPRIVVRLLTPAAGVALRPARP
jgi:hypothetical protein